MDKNAPACALLKTLKEDVRTKPVVTQMIQLYFYRKEVKKEKKILLSLLSFRKVKMTLVALPDTPGLNVAGRSREGL